MSTVTSDIGNGFWSPDHVVIKRKFDEHCLEGCIPSESANIVQELSQLWTLSLSCLSFKTIVSETGFHLLLHVEPTQTGPTERASLCLQMETRFEKKNGISAQVFMSTL
jgi:hypothetical protein